MVRALTTAPAASSGVPARPRPLRAAGAAAAPSAPTSPSAPGAVVSFLPQGAWLHVQLHRADAVKLQGQLARVIGPG